MYRFALIILITGPLLAGCGGEDGRQTEDQRPKGALEQAVEAQKAQLEKAKAVEQQMKDAAEKQSQEIDEQGGGPER